MSSQVLEKEAQALSTLTGAAYPKWTRDFDTGLTGDEKDSFVEMAGGAETVRQVLRGEMQIRLVKAAGKSKSNPVILGGLLEEDEETILFPAAGRFVVREQFAEDLNTEVPISMVHGASVEEFLDIIEEHAPAAALKRRKLLGRADNTKILLTLCGKHTTVAVAHVLEFLKTADRLQWFHFFLRRSLSMIVHWDGYGWNLEILPARHPREWEKGNFVVSP